MKKLIIALTMLVVSAVHAGEIKIKSISQYELWGSAHVSAAFGINPEMGRAWIEVTTTANDPDGGLSDIERLKIEGLTFDQQTGAINIDFEGKITTCAEYKTVGRSIFRQKLIKMTSNCKFEGRWKKITYDNGFEMQKTSKYEIFLIVE
jgi:UDP-N-acetylglucosamine enolpyruvyl transferase